MSQLLDDLAWNGDVPQSIGLGVYTIASAACIP